MTRRRLKILILLVPTLTYVGTFTVWWLGSPTEVYTENGKRVRYVNFQMTPFRWHTRPLWEPAFFFMEEVCGYRPVAMVAAEEHSIYTYAK